MRIYKLKPHKENILREWSRRLMTDLRPEAVASMREENCTREYFYLFCIGDTYYFAANMEGDNIIAASESLDINVQHKAILRECVEEKIELETLYDIRAE